MSVALWMAGTIASFTLMGIGGRELATELDTYGILFFRSVIGLAVVCALLQRKGWQRIKTTRLPTHLMRNLIHFWGQFGWFFGISLLPLAQVFALEFTVPLWGILLAAVFLGERITTPGIAALVLGFIGVLVILRPGIVPFDIATFAVLASALCYAIAHITTKSLISTDAPLTILFYMTVIQLPIGAIGAWSGLSMPSPAMWPWIVVVGLTGLSAHYCLAKAFSHGDATLVLPLDFLRLPVIAIAAALLYGERIDIWLFAGAALMIVGNLVNLRAEAKSR